MSLHAAHPLSAEIADFIARLALAKGDGMLEHNAAEFLKQSRIAAAEYERTRYALAPARA